MISGSQSLHHLSIGGKAFARESLGVSNWPGPGYLAEGPGGGQEMVSRKGRGGSRLTWAEVAWPRRVTQASVLACASFSDCHVPAATTAPPRAFPVP